jgi:catechol 2,3-dioxygenase-like lactoylglutathione lyase family enzyme
MSATEPRTQITEVRTVGIPVTDQDRALAFYRDTLGFETRLDGEFGEGLRWIEVAPPGSATTIALVRPASAESTGVDTGVRPTTMSATTDHEALKARGVDVDPEIIPYPVPMFTMPDPDANRLYIVEASEAG